MVRRHQRDRRARQQARPADLASVQQHLREAQVVRCRRHRPRAAGVRGRRVARIDEPERLPRRRILVERRRETPPRRGRYREARVGHVQRTEQSRREEVAEPHARRGLDDAPEDIRCEAVLEHGARLVDERRGREARDLDVRREIAGVVVDRRLEDAGGLVGALHREVLRDLAVRESGGVAEQVVHRHLAHGRDGRVVDLREFRVGLRDADLLRAEGRQELRDRIGQLHLAVLDEHHRRDRHERLRHRVDAEDGIGRHRCAARRIAMTHGRRVHELAAARDHHDGTGQLARVDLGLQRGADARQALGRHPHGFRRGGRQRLRERNGRCAEQGGGEGGAGAGSCERRADGSVGHGGGLLRGEGRIVGRVVAGVRCAIGACTHCAAGRTSSGRRRVDVRPGASGAVSRYHARRRAAPHHVRSPRAIDGRVAPRRFAIPPPRRALVPSTPVSPRRHPGGSRS